MWPKEGAESMTGAAVGAARSKFAAYGTRDGARDMCEKPPLNAASGTLWKSCDYHECYNVLDA